MTQIAFIGLGVMGAPMASNLINAGHDVTCFTRTPEKGRALVEKGARMAGSVAEAVQTAEVVITMLPDSPDVQAVVLGEAGVLAHAARGTLLIDASTIKPETSKAISHAATAQGIRALDAPVSGGEAGAIEGSLSIMVGGDREDFDAALPTLRALGSTIVHVGPSGAGQTVKAANQLMVAGHLQLLAEALVFLDAHSVDLESAINVLGGGLAGSTVLQRKSPNMLKRNFTPGFRIDLHHKDLGIVIDSARAAGVSIPLGAHVAELVASLRAQGAGGLDHSALLLQVEELSGRGRSELDEHRS
ncbi:2-hydroxy-3-oxopropionate reductase [Microbacterium rhizomatis]|uniref:2-hydroxy-3-oxopropionate reductase n=1 Tax=Microbacterium rhizomatis TaxID=1631477 RepID=A0A5J5J072_9MICO|nr:2-hydroxy-3-oxopropionate reductase [Microbacterium rhizomatis]KAA9105872.1 2-hydroxy-3-oxopropionate reductase [Microbacterium rhizomatis]